MPALSRDCSQKNFFNRSRSSAFNLSPRFRNGYVNFLFHFTSSWACLQFKRSANEILPQAKDPKGETVCTFSNFCKSTDTLKRLDDYLPNVKLSEEEKTRFAFLALNRLLDNPQWSDLTCG